MGLTPAGGLVMGTRSGDLDPGVLLYLLQEKARSPATLDYLVNQRSGLIGVSGSTSDMHDLLRREADDPHAAEAIELFCYQAKKFSAALAAVLGGLDTLVFTAGIGTNAPAVRWRICQGLEFLGIRLDRGPQRRQRRGDQLRRQPGHGPRDEDRRGVDDRPAHVQVLGAEASPWHVPSGAMIDTEKRYHMTPRWRYSLRLSVSTGALSWTNRFPPICCERWTPTGGRPTTCPSARSISTTIRC